METPPPRRHARDATRTGRTAPRAHHPVRPVLDQLHRVAVLQVVERRPTAPHSPHQPHPRHAVAPSNCDHMHIRRRQNSRYAWRSSGSLVKTTALPCRCAARATQASTASGRFFTGSTSCPNAVPMRRQSARSEPVVQARHTGRPGSFPSSAARQYGPAERRSPSAPRPTRAPAPDADATPGQGPGRGPTPDAGLPAPPRGARPPWPCARRAR